MQGVLLAEHDVCPRWPSRQHRRPACMRASPAAHSMPQPGTSMLLLLLVCLHRSVCAPAASCLPCLGSVAQAGDNIQKSACVLVCRHLRLCWCVSAGCASAGTARTARQASARARCARSRGGRASTSSSAGCPAAATSTMAAACRTSSRTLPAGSCGTRPRCASSCRPAAQRHTVHEDRPAGSHRSAAFVALEAAGSGRCLAVRC